MSHPTDRDEDCYLRLTVVPRWGGTSSRGTACRGHGGHCRPDEYCEQRRQRMPEVDEGTS